MRIIRTKIKNGFNTNKSEYSLIYRYKIYHFFSALIRTEFKRKPSMQNNQSLF